MFIVQVGYEQDWQPDPAGPRFSLNNDMYEASVDIGVAIDACMYGL